MIKASMIHQDWWEKAYWTGIDYSWAPASNGLLIPVMGLVFEEPNFAMDVFFTLEALTGGDDTVDLLPVTIVEGEQEGLDPGYTVILGGGNADLPEGAYTALCDSGEGRTAAFSKRIGFWDPRVPCAWLEMFKKTFAETGMFLLAPCVGKRLMPHPALGLGILKRACHFRQSASAGVQLAVAGAAGA